MGRFLYAEGRIVVHLWAQCIRCLDDFALDLAIPFNQNYLPQSQPISEAESEAEFIPFSGDILDLEPAVSEALLMALPMKPLCRKDCPGICAGCGKNLKEEKCTCALATGHPGLSGLARLLPKKEV